MREKKATIVVTGVSGNLGSRLLPHLSNYRVIGLDMHAPPSGAPELAHFEQMDLGVESSCIRLVEIIREHDVSAVVHLAFVIDPLRTGVLDKDRMWQINVAGTARVMEAIAEVNRQGGHVEKFIFPSSVSAYGPETSSLVTEEHALGAHTLPYAVHKQESDKVVQLRAVKLGECSTFILRPHIFVGATMQNYLVGALRGTPTGKGCLGEWARSKGKRLPMLLPFGEQYLEKKFQFVHVDDMARLIAFILDRQAVGPEIQILNVAGRGEALTLARCAAIANAKIVRLPSRFLCALALKLFWDIGLSGVPPEALPYIIGSYTMDTTRLGFFLGSSYKQVMRYTIEEALVDSFPPTQPELETEPVEVNAASSST
ncbi:MAG: NAD-dependent epimerase/dehydratase [Acidobacteriales bacterium]|nr:NAD-dependent epimerase/dehydratase [Terriglobales bacterium]